MRFGWWWLFASDHLSRQGKASLQEIGTLQGEKTVFSGHICTKEQRKGQPSAKQGHSIAKFMLFFQLDGELTHLPVPLAISAHAEHYLPRTLPEMTSQDESFMMSVDSYIH